MKHNKVLFLIFHIFVIMFVLTITQMFTLTDNSDSMKLLEAVLLILYIYTVLTAKMYLSWLNSYMIFLYTLFLFNFSRVFLDIIGYKTFGWATKFANYYFYYSIRIEILEVFLLILLFTHLGFAISILNETELYQKVDLKNKAFFTQTGIFLFLISLPGIMIKMLIQLRLILQVGYEAYYTGVLKNINYPVFTKGSGTIMTIGFLIFLISIPSKKKFISITSLYLLVKLIDSLKGARAVFLTQLLFIMWYYYKVYGTKIRLGTIIKLGAFTMVFSQILVSVRSKKVFSLDLINGIFDFLHSQGVSYLVLGYLIQFKSYINESETYPYILQGIFGFAPQSMETLKNTNSLADRLTYYLNPGAYLRGEGIGSNYIAEFYDLGYIWLIICSVILGYVIIKYEKSAARNRYMLLLSAYFIPNLFYIPRGSFFGSGLLKGMIFYTVLYAGINIFESMYFRIKGVYNDRKKDLLYLDGRERKT
jgi:oligosaccharide repeat unit polymerase